MRKFFAVFGAVFVSFLVGAKALAVCPVCTVTVGVGIELSRWCGVDDSIIGLWVGGLIVSMIFWTIGWLNRKNIRFIGKKIITVLFYYLIIVIPLYYKGVFDKPCSDLWGLNKMVVGITLGSILFFSGVMLYEYLKKRNGGKAYFPFQKVVMPILPLIILSVVFYFIISR
ncbi:MAG: hypothetical protein WC310_03835 [Patescibacteria group bacterium]|jgi:hypothetical protein